MPPTFQRLDRVWGVGAGAISTTGCSGPGLLSLVRPEGSAPLVPVVVGALRSRPMTPWGQAARWFGRCGRFWLVGGVVSEPQPTFPRGALTAWFRGVSPRFGADLGLVNLHLVPT